MSLQTDLIEFLRGERKPMRRQMLCAAIQREAAYNAAWPRATIEEWDKALAEAVKAGELVLGGDTGDVVWLPVKAVKPAEKQMDLF